MGCFVKKTLKNISNEELEIKIKQATNWAHLCRILELSALGGNQHHLKLKCIKLGLDFSHFNPYGKGKPSNSRRRDINLYLENKCKN